VSEDMSSRVSADLLERAAWALSVEADVTPAPAPDTRARILQRLAASQHRRPRRRVALALGSLLFLSGSLALATVGAPAAARAWRAVIQKLSPRASVGPQPRSARQVSIRRPVAGPRIQPLVAPPAPAAPAVAEPPTTAVPRPHRAAVVVPAPPPVPQSSTLALFHQAHRLHFHQHDDAAALAAWDRYLAADPTGPLVLEARYNRALCLLRLGRGAEARAALRPFADGTVTHYRQAEARALIEQLPGGNDLTLPASP
jgi:hypothetical protein